MAPLEIAIGLCGFVVDQDELNSLRSAAHFTTKKEQSDIFRIENRKILSSDLRHYKSDPSGYCDSLNDSMGPYGKEVAGLVDKTQSLLNHFAAAFA